MYTNIDVYSTDENNNNVAIRLSQNETKKEEQNIKEKKGENLYIKQKENAKREARIKKLEREIEELENINAKNKELLQNEEVYTNYEKLTEIQNEIESINKKIENYMEEWEKLMEI